MAVIEISKFRDTLVLHFVAEGNSVNAYTLATTLVAVADAAKAANAELNPGYEIEIVVDAFGPGSFRAKIRAIYREARNLFSNHKVETIILGLITNYIFMRVWQADPGLTVHVHTDEVIVQRGDDRLVVPREIYDATRRVERHEEFVSAVSNAARAVAADPAISALSFVPELESPAPAVLIGKADLAEIGGMPKDSDENRVIEEESTLQIVKAILERGRRKWEFVWRGVKISAPVLDESFYSKFFAHEITIAPGDSLLVRLAMKQKRDPDTGIYTNWDYEVREVIDHIPRVRQMALIAAEDSPSDAE